MMAQGTDDSSLVMIRITVWIQDPDIFKGLFIVALTGNIEGVKPLRRFICI